MVCKFAAEFSVRAWPSAFADAETPRRSTARAFVVAREALLVRRGILGLQRVG
jgi:hypothetical protein